LLSQGGEGTRLARNGMKEDSFLIFKAKKNSKLKKQISRVQVARSQIQKIRAQKMKIFILWKSWLD